MLTDLIEHPPRGASRLSFEVEKDRIELLIKPVLDQTVIHTTRFHRDDKLRIVIDKFDSSLHCLGWNTPAAPTSSWQ